MLYPGGRARCSNRTSNRGFAVPLFEWTPEYSVSVVRFDNEHKKLFSLMNELNEAMQAGQGRMMVLHVLQELADYVRKHFEAEEEAMRAAGYSGLEDHIAEHKALSAAVTKYHAEYDAKSGSLAIDLLFFLRKWLQRHILVTDRKYSQTLNSMGIH
jgi:hemerythrin